MREIHTWQSCRRGRHVTDCPAIPFPHISHSHGCPITADVPLAQIAPFSQIAPFPQMPHSPQLLVLQLDCELIVTSSAPQAGLTVTFRGEIPWEMMSRRSSRLWEGKSPCLFLKYWISMSACCRARGLLEVTPT